jgi:hypothetical protein
MTCASADSQSKLRFCVAARSLNMAGWQDALARFMFSVRRTSVRVALKALTDMIIKPSRRDALPTILGLLVAFT